VRVLFWGTPDFATPALRALLGEGFDVVGVVTQPDKPVGRSRSTLHTPPVKQVALEEGLPVLQPDRPRGPDFVSSVRELEPDISVVVAYGHLLSQEIIDLPPRGTLNIHASLLPDFRGAAPIQAAIRAGCEWTGVSIMRMIRQLDAGPVILQLGTSVNEDETYGELSLRLAEMGAAALIEALALIEADAATATPQMESLATYAPKIDRALTRIDWSRSALDVARAIRAFDPTPGAFAVLDDVDVKLFGARKTLQEGPSGEVVAASGDGIVIACGEGAVRVSHVQPAGKRRLTAREWMTGRGIEVGRRFT
jgi:methionyl-tRNA formyltransferase